jgi:hypothetical protein
MPVALLAAASFGGCTCSKGGATAGVDAASSASAASSGAQPPAPSGESDSVFSAPIGAARVAGGSVVVAGLVVDSKTIVATSTSPSGAIEWTVDALRGVGWNSDAKLGVLPFGDGAAIVWSGPREGRTSTFVAFVGAKGDLQGDFIETGAAPCTTQDTLVWVDPSVPPGFDGGSPTAHGSSRPSALPMRHVRARAWGSSATRDVTSLDGDPTPNLVCGDHSVYAIVDGDDERTVRVLFGPGAAPDGGPSTRATIDDGELGDDEERDFQAYSVADDLGMVRAGSSGEIALRELSGGKLGPWARLTHKLVTDDDIEIVDADKTEVAIVYTNDEGDSCGGASAEAKSVHVLRVDRKTHKDRPAVKVAPAECGKNVGPFWIGERPDSLAVGWAEQGKRGEAAIRGFSFALLSQDPPTAQHADQPADALVDAGCDKLACYAVALVRPPGNDGMAPEPIKLLRYP